MSIKIITTEDGSHSLLNDEMNETYHSTRGARGESLHVFIKEGLEYFLAKRENISKVSILEIGLGTGLNAFLTNQFADIHDQKISFYSLEPFPIQKEIYDRLNYFDSNEEKELFLEIHQVDWETSIDITKFFSLTKSTHTLQSFESSQLFNIIYFDAFAPSKQPEVWSMENIEKCFHLLKTSGILVTYCAQGQFKRNLKAAGFEVETLQGAMGKKEMVRAHKV